MKNCSLHPQKTAITKIDTPTKFLPNITAWKEATQQLIQENTTSKDNEIAELKKMFRESNERLEKLEIENQRMKNENKAFQEKTNEIIAEIMSKQYEFTNKQISTLETIQENEKINSVRHCEMMKILQKLSSSFDNTNFDSSNHDSERKISKTSDERR